jgi:hypothetical protein
MKALVGLSEEICQKLHVNENDFNYLKTGLDNVIKCVVQGVENSSSVN